MKKHHMKNNTIKKPTKCPYCGAVVHFKPASFVYGTERTTDEDHVYVCSRYPECDAYVNAHKGSQIPKGTLADGYLRNKRIRAHRTFDQIWQYGLMDRTSAYHWLADRLALGTSQAHIGQFSLYYCDQVIAEAEKFIANNQHRIQASVLAG